VKAEEIKNDPNINKYPILSEGKYSGCIGIGGLVLARDTDRDLKTAIGVFQKNYFRSN